MVLKLIRFNILFSIKIGQYQILELKYLSDKYQYHIFMGVLFVLISQNRNLTHERITFQVQNGLGPVPGLCPVPDLEPRTTGIVKLHRILRYCRRHANGPNWTIGVFSGGVYTGVELTSDHLLFNTRLVFRHERNGEGKNVLRVDGVPENCTDNLLRHRYFGCLRNIIWDKRSTVLIGHEDSLAATKLRKMEAPSGQQPGSLTPTPLQQKGSHVPNPSTFGKQNSDYRHVTTKVREEVAMGKYSETLTHTRTKEKTVMVVDSQPSLPRSSTSEKVQNHTDRFVHGIVLLLAFVIILFVRAVTG